MLRDIHSVDDIDASLEESYLLDANVIIQYLDPENIYHEIVSSKLNELYLGGVMFYYPAPALLEIKNHWRLKLIHEAIQFTLDNGGNFYNDFTKYFNNVAGTRKKKNGYLKEHDIKELKETLLKIHNNKGVDRWFQLCKSALDSKISELEKKLSQTNIKYTNFGDEVIFLKNEQGNWPKWSTADKLIESYALSSNDAAIMNMAQTSRIDGFISNDNDIILAIKNGAYFSDKKFYTFLVEGERINTSKFQE